MLIYRAYMISTSYTSFHEKIEKLKVVFSRNGYPSSFVDECISIKKKEILHTVPKMDMNIVLSCLGTTLWKVKNDIIPTFQKNVRFCNLKIVFKTGKRLSAFFLFKDRFPKSLFSGVIYRFTCAKRNLSYVGCTKRYWKKRLYEHTRLPALTGKPLAGVQIYAPMEHARASCHVKVTHRHMITAR